MKFVPIKPAIMVKILEKAGFIVRRQKGSHVILFKPTVPRPISVPLHSGDLPKGTQRAILRQAQISLEDFKRFLQT